MDDKAYGKRIWEAGKIRTIIFTLRIFDKKNYLIILQENYEKINQDIFYSFGFIDDITFGHFCSDEDKVFALC